MRVFVYICTCVHEWCSKNNFDEPAVSYRVGPRDQAWREEPLPWVISQAQHSPQQTYCALLGIFSVPYLLCWMWNKQKLSQANASVSRGFYQAPLPAAGGVRAWGLAPEALPSPGRVLLKAPSFWACRQNITQAVTSFHRRSLRQSLGHVKRRTVARVFEESS